MYTNGYTKTRFNSLVVVTNNARPIGYRVFTTDEFARESEHITLETPTDSGIAIAHDGKGSIGAVFTGI